MRRERERGGRGRRDGADLAPLRHLTAIEGKDSTDGCSLCLWDNANLVSVAALGRRRGALPGGRFVHNHLKLAGLEGLEGLDGVGRSVNGRRVYIFNNDALTSLRGLAGLRGALPGSLTVLDNGALPSLSGLDGVTGVGAQDAWGYSLRTEGGL